jgi:membrane glycosyltransferase
MMLIQSGIVVAILRGKDAGWSAQRRDAERNLIADLLSRHRLHMAAGLLLALVAETISPIMLAWLLPAVAGLVLAIPLSGLTASSAVGDGVARAGLLLTPEDTSPPPLDALAAAARRFYCQAVADGRDIIRLLRDEQRRRVHFALLDRFNDRKRGHVDPVHALAAAKIAEAQTVEEALSFLDEGEQVVALAMPELCERLAALPASASGR